MNNETYQENQAFERHFFDWLMNRQSVENKTCSAQDSLSSAASAASHEEGSRVKPQEWEELDPLDSEEIDDFDYHSQPFTLGEIPAVKNRFETVLKNRLIAEMQKHPPLFPWETQAAAFTDYPDVLEEEEVPDFNVWTAHQKNLRWSIPIPEPIFAQLLNPCQEVVQSSLREGAKLVRAVETLFPEQSEPLNELTNRLMLGWGRTPRPDALPCYETATPEQQMLMALLAAQEIIQSLTLAAQANQPPVKQQWLTTLGLLSVEIEYIQTQDNTSLKVLGHLPDGGRMWLSGDDVETTAQRSQRGYLKLELVDPKPNHLLRLNILLHNHDHDPLSFAICPQLTP